MAKKRKDSRRVIRIIVEERNHFHNPFKKNYIYLDFTYKTYEDGTPERFIYSLTVENDFASILNSSKTMYDFMMHGGIFYMSRRVSKNLHKNTISISYYIKKHKGLEDIKIAPSVDEIYLGRTIINKPEQNTFRHKEPQYILFQEEETGEWMSWYVDDNIMKKTADIYSE